MDHRHWHRVQALFDAAVTQPPANRRQFLRAECGDDTGLLNEVEALLEAHGEVEGLFDGDAILPTLMRLPAGHRLGPYRIVDFLGAGGMSVVYEAHDTRLERAVALKVLAPHLTASDGARARLLVEARAASRIDHPNICTVFDIGDSGDGDVYIAMALYKGQTLEARLEHAGALPVAEALDVAAQIAEGLRAAHTAGILHRDIKPANVIVTRDGTVKLIDFGIAKLADVQLTATGATLGTFSYMAPEQLRGETLDERADLWSLGVVLYEMLTGRRAFHGEHAHSIMNAVLNEEPQALASLLPTVPAQVEALIARLLAKERQDRYDSASRLLTDLRAIHAGLDPDTAPRAGATPGAGNGGSTRPNGVATDSHPATSPPAPRFARVWPLAAMAVSLAALAAAAWVFLAGPLRPEAPTPAPATRSSPVPAPAQSAPSAPRDRRSIAVLPFANLSADPAQEYFSDGLADTLLQKLSGVRDLRVAARTSSFAFKGEAHSARTLGERLGVATVLEGSVQKHGDRVRVIAQLIDTADGSQLWAATFDRAGDDVFRVQDEIAQAVVGALELTLLEAGGTAPATGEQRARAYELYLLGRQHWHLRTRESLTRAAEYFRAAIERDPGYALAYTGLADTYLLLNDYGDLPPDDFWDNLDAARAALDKALALDERLAEAHASLGLLREHYASPDAEQAFRRALELNPNYLNAYLWYADSLRRQDRLEESLGLLERALALDPVSYLVVYEVAETLRLLGRAEEAIARYRRAIELQPAFPAPYFDVARIAYRHGDLPGAVDAFEAGIERDPRNAAAMAALATTLTDLGLLEESLEWSARALALQPALVDALEARGEVAIARGEYRENLRLLRAALDREPDSRALLALAGFAELLLGNHQRAREHYESAKWAMGFDAALLDPTGSLRNIAHALSLAYVYRGSGDEDRARSVLADQAFAVERLRARAPRLFGLDVVQAGIHALRGEPGAALRALERAVGDGWRRGWLLAHHPVFASLRDEAGFVALLARLETQAQAMRAKLAPGA